MGDVDENSLKEKLESCKHFLVDSGIGNERNRVYNIAMDTLDPKFLLGKLNFLFDSLKCAAKLSVAFGFVLKNVEDGSCRYFYTHYNDAIVERSKLVATTEDLVKINTLISNTDISEGTEVGNIIGKKRELTQNCSFTS